MAFAARALPVLAAAALAACASLPPAQPSRVAKAPQAWASTLALAAPEALWPGDGWWKAYGDPQLDALMDEALAGSPDLAQARARVEKALTVRAEAVAAGLPGVTANGGVSYAKQSYNVGIPPQFVPHGYNDYGQGTLNFNWELDFWGRNRAAVAAATSDARAEAAAAAEARLMLTTNVADAYAALARLYATRDLTVRAIEVRRQTFDLTQQRLANGLDTRAELDQAQAGPSAGRANLAAVDEEIALTRDALAALLGDGPDRGLAITRPGAIALTPFGLPPRLPVDLIGRRPDVAAARWRAEAADQRIAQAKAAFYPNINLAAYIGQQALHLDMLTAAGSTEGSVGPALRLPIFDGGSLRAQLRGARADHDAAVAAYDAAVTQALREVADATASERALGERLSQSRQALAADEAAYQVATLRYQGGLSTFQAVLLAEDAVLTQRQLVSDLESRALSLDVALVRALGGGFNDPA